ncbi:unnamed protein product [Lota lota]
MAQSESQHSERMRPWEGRVSFEGGGGTRGDQGCWTSLGSGRPRETTVVVNKRPQHQVLPSRGSINNKQVDRDCCVEDLTQCALLQGVTYAAFLRSGTTQSSLCKEVFLASD